MNNIYDDKYKAGYREKLEGFEVARWHALEDVLKKEIDASKKLKVLDYGCGSGLFVDLWLSQFPDSEFNFADISSSGLDLLKKKYPGVASATSLIEHDTTQYEEGMFDLVVSVEVMEHVTHLQNYLDDVYRILRPGGKFIWTTPCGNNLSIEHIYSLITDNIQKTEEGYRKWKWEDPTHLRRLKTSEIKGLLKKTGFNMVTFKLRSHFFSFLCTRLYSRKWISQSLAVKLMVLDYKWFRNFSNGASMIGIATK